MDPKGHRGRFSEYYRFEVGKGGKNMAIPVCIRYVNILNSSLSI